MTKKKNSQEQLVFNMKQARSEIIKMAAQGFYPKRREKMSEANAVELGGRPDRKKYHNYKELKEIRKKQKELKDLRMKAMDKGKNMLTNTIKKKVKNNKKQKQKQK